MTVPPLLALRGLEKRFGAVVAVAGVDLEVAEGEFVSLLGPSGCGKTTILRCVAGFEQPDRGEIRLAGAVVDRLPPERRDIGMVFQSYALFPNMTVAGNIAFPMKLRGVPAAERVRRVEELLGMVRLPGYGSRRISELSGGQKQRVALARALAKEPRLLLLDEPLSALDAKIREELRVEIRRIQKELGITAIYVTHDQEEALAISDRVVVMNAGRIEQLGTPVEIYRRPGSRFVAGFVGTMNFLEGRIEDGRLLHRGRRFLHREVGDWPEGSRVLLALRPEELRLVETGEGEPSENRLEAVAGPAIFLGATVRLRLTRADGSTLEMDLPAERAGALPMGTTVTVTFSPAAGVLLPAEEEERPVATTEGKTTGEGEGGDSGGTGARETSQADHHRGQERESSSA